MKKSNNKVDRRWRVSVFVAGQRLDDGPIKHTASFTEKAGRAQFKKLVRLIGGTSGAARVVLHQGNLRRMSYVIHIDETRAWSELDSITARNTAFDRFDDLCEAPAYTPSLNVGKPELARLADAFEQQTGRRAYRWSY